MKKKNRNYDQQIESLNEENQHLRENNQRLKQENHNCNQQIESLNEENQHLRENNQLVKQENHNYNQQIENLKEEKQRLIQQNQQLMQEIQKGKKIDDLKKTIPSHTERIEHQNLPTTAPSSTPRTSIGASATVPG